MWNWVTLNNLIAYSLTAYSLSVYSLQPDLHRIDVRIESFHLCQPHDVPGLLFEGCLGVVDKAGLLDKMVDGKS